jgi:hypothetical protein
MNEKDYFKIRDLAVKVFESGFKLNCENSFESLLKLVVKDKIENKNNKYSYMPLLCLSTIAMTVSAKKYMSELISLYNMLKEENHPEMQGNLNLLHKRLKAKTGLMSQEQLEKFQNHHTHE